MAVETMEIISWDLIAQSVAGGIALSMFPLVIGSAVSVVLNLFKQAM